MSNRYDDRSNRADFVHVSELVWKAIDLLTIDGVAAALNVDERSIRRWRDRQVLPSLSSYLALCRLVSSKGGDDSPFAILKGLLKIFRSKMVSFNYYNSI